MNTSFNTFIIINHNKCIKHYNYFEKNNYNQAAFWYKTALNCIPNKDNPSLTNIAYYSRIPSLQLCVCYYNLGKINCAYFFNELTANFVGESDKVIYNRKLFDDIYENLNMKKPNLKYPLRADVYFNYLLKYLWNKDIL